MAEQRDYDLRKLQDRLDDTNLQVSRGKEENSRQFADQNQLQRQRDRAAEERMVLARNNDIEEGKARELS